MSSPLSGALSVAAESGGLQRRIGTISSLSPLTATLANDTQLIVTGRLTSYYPIVGDNVLVLIDDSGAAIVAGKLTIAADGWIYPSLGAGFGQRGGAFANMRYRFIEAMNAVWLHGEITNGGSPNGQLIFTLPVGLRPKYYQGFPLAARYNSAPNPTPVLEISTDGSVRPYDLAGGNAIVINGFVALD